MVSRSGGGAGGGVRVCVVWKFSVEWNQQRWGSGGALGLQPDVQTGHAEIFSYSIITVQSVCGIMMKSFLCLCRRFEKCCTLSCVLALAGPTATFSMISVQERNTKQRRAKFHTKWDWKLNYISVRPDRCSLDSVISDFAYLVSSGKGPIPGSPLDSTACWLILYQLLVSHLIGPLRLSPAQIHSHTLTHIHAILSLGVDWMSGRTPADTHGLIPDRKLQCKLPGAEVTYA